jgi:hypothetical protein
MSVSMLYYFFRAFLVQVNTLTPHKTGRLLAVSPDMAKFLTVITLRDPRLSFIRFYPVCNMAKARQFEYLMGL